LHLILAPKKDAGEQEKNQHRRNQRLRQHKRRTDSVTQHSAVGTQPSAKIWHDAIAKTGFLLSSDLH